MNASSATLAPDEHHRWSGHSRRSYKPLVDQYLLRGISSSNVNSSSQGRRAVTGPENTFESGDTDVMTHAPKALHGGNTESASPQTRCCGDIAGWRAERRR